MKLWFFPHTRRILWLSAARIAHGYAKRVIVWSFGVRYAERENLLPILQTELDALEESVSLTAEYSQRECDILSARLTRRYDPAMAFTEAVHRAIEAKKAARESIMHLTINQEEALNYQKEHLLGILAKT